MTFSITSRARVDWLFITALFSLLQAGCTTHHVFVIKEMTWECAPEHYMPDFPDAQTVRFRFVEAPEYDEEVSGRGLCDKLKASGKKTVLVGYDTFGNSFDGLVGFNEETVDGERIANAGGWGSSGSHSMQVRPHPLEKLYKKHFKTVRQAAQLSLLRLDLMRRWRTTEQENKGVFGSW